MLIERIGQGVLIMLKRPTALHKNSQRYVAIPTSIWKSFSLAGRARAQGDVGNEKNEVQLD